MRTHSSPRARYKTTREKFLARRLLRRRHEPVRRWYHKKYLLFPLVAIILFVTVFGGVLGAFRITGLIKAKMDYRRLHRIDGTDEMLEVVISKEVLEEKEDMDYEIAKKIYAGEINAVPEVDLETLSETDPEEDQ